MKYTPTDVARVTIVDIEPHRDYRGFFSCSFCADEFAECRLNSTVAQTNISFNYTQGTLRGLHRQMPPYAEANRPVLRILRVPPSLSRAPEAICDGIRDRGRDGRARDAGGVADRGGAESRAASTCW